MCRVVNTKRWGVFNKLGMKKSKVWEKQGVLRNALLEKVAVLYCTVMSTRTQMRLNKMNLERAELDFL